MAIKQEFLPVIPTRGFIIYPGTVFHFDVARKQSICAINAALCKNGFVFLASQTDDSVEEPTPDDLHKFGIVAKILRTVTTPDGVRVLIEGTSRGLIASIEKTEGFYTAGVKIKSSSVRNLSPEHYAALLNHIHILLSNFAELDKKIASAPFLKNLPEDNPSHFCDIIAENLLRRNEDKLALLEITNVKKRLLKLLDLLTTEYKISEAESIISLRVKEQMEDNNRDYYLREQLKAIHSELGDDDFDETDALREKIESTALSDDAYEKAMRELRSLEKMQPTSPEANISRHYLEVLCSVPWGIQTPLCTDISAAQKELDKSHYGMEKVKERILEQLAVINRTHKPCGSVLCLVGAPGVGKTSVAKSIARACGRKFERISLGGMRDEAELRGHRKTYIGAMPGRIADALRKAKASNPLILLDEIDKLGSDYKGDPSSALLEILDPEQNSSFRDNFLETGIDLSGVLFIATANTVDTIPAPLVDRLEILELPSYTDDEKLNIAKKHLIPAQLSFHSMPPHSVRFSSKAVLSIITDYTREAGVRSLEREIQTVVRKCVMRASKGDNADFSVTEKNLSDFLGKKRYFRDEPFGKPCVGIVNGLAWTSVGGEVLLCECAVSDGGGKLILTGKLGDVMKESAQTALGYVRGIATDLGISSSVFKEKDIHIHFPEGAVPKDGPSAGITIATALVSALCSVPLKSGIAMTGEISLTGRVMPIGGLREKALGAYRLGIKEIIIPKDNEKDLSELPTAVLKSIVFYPVSDCREVFKICLVKSQPQPHPENKPERTRFYEYS